MSYFMGVSDGLWNFRFKREDYKNYTKLATEELHKIVNLGIKRIELIRVRVDEENEQFGIMGFRVEFNNTL
jgi:hypothetical protein